MLSLIQCKKHQNSRNNGQEITHATFATFFYPNKIPNTSQFKNMHKFPMILIFFEKEIMMRPPEATGSNDQEPGEQRFWDSALRFLILNKKNIFHDRQHMFNHTTQAKHANPFSTPKKWTTYETHRRCIKDILQHGGHFKWRIVHQSSQSQGWLKQQSRKRRVKFSKGNALSKKERLPLTHMPQRVKRP